MSMKNHLYVLSFVALSVLSTIGGFLACAKKPVQEARVIIIGNGDTTTVTIDVAPVSGRAGDSLIMSRLPPTFRPIPTQRIVRVYFQKGSAKLDSNALRAMKRMRPRGGMVTGYASSERGKRPALVEQRRNYTLSLARAAAICAAVRYPCTPIAGGETSDFGDELRENRVAGFLH